MTNDIIFEKEQSFKYCKMDIRTLTIEEIRQTYKEHLRYDFPPDELKPLDRIEVSINEGKYLCIGAFEDGKLIAYAFFVMTGDKCLLDYYAVIPQLRGKGIGSAFLSEAIRKADSSFTMIEIDDPSEAADEKEKLICQKRMDFYLNAGCINTEVRVAAFGVRFLLLEYPLKQEHSALEVSEGYKDIYREILPQRMFDENIKIIN